MTAHTISARRVRRMIRFTLNAIGRIAQGETDAE